MLLFPLEEGRVPLSVKNWIPSTQGCFVPSLVEIGQMVLEKKLKMWKVYRRTDRQTDRQQAIRKAHLSIQLKIRNKLHFLSCNGIWTCDRYVTNSIGFWLTACSYPNATHKRYISQVKLYTWLIHFFKWNEKYLTISSIENVGIPPFVVGPGVKYSFSKI